MNKVKIVEAFRKGECGLEDSIVKVDGIRYKITNHNEDDWVDEGKYQYTSEEGRLCSCDEDFNIIDKFSIWIQQSVARSGSYYTDWDYYYDDVTAYRVEKVMIPEVVIPAHVEEKRFYIK